MAAPSSRSISGELSGKALNERRAVTRKEAGPRAATAAVASRLSVSRSSGTSCAREKFATPNRSPRRRCASVHGTSSGRSARRRPARTWTRPPRSARSRRALTASRSTKNGRLRPLSAISWYRRTTFTACPRRLAGAGGGRDEVAVLQRGTLPRARVGASHAPDRGGEAAGGGGLVEAPGRDAVVQVGGRHPRRGEGLHHVRALDRADLLLAE